MATAALELVRQKLNGERYADVADNTVADAKIRRLALLDLLMGVLMAVVAWKYNKGEKMLLRVATTVVAFLFWHLYGLYFLIRRGVLDENNPLQLSIEGLKKELDLRKRGNQLTHDLLPPQTGAPASMGGNYF